MCVVQSRDGVDDFGYTEKGTLLSFIPFFECIARTMNGSMLVETCDLGI